MPSPRRPVAAVATLALAAGFGGGFLLGRDMGGTGGAGEERPRAEVSPSIAPVSGPLRPAESCAALVDFYVDNTLDQVTPWGWEQPFIAYAAQDSGALLRDRATVTELGPTPAGVTSSKSGTNVQEAGVDEPDVVKASGDLLVRAVGQDLVTYDVSGERVREVASVPALSRREQSPELLLTGDRVVLTSTEWERTWRGHRGGAHDPVTLVRHYDVSDPASPRLLTTQEYDGRLLSARLYDDVVRLVLTSGLPDLDFVEPGEDRSEKEALARNRQVVRDSTAEDWLMTVTTDGGEAEPAVDCADVQVPEEFAGAGSVVVVGFAADEPAAPDASAVAAASELVYSSTDRLYLATMAGWGWGGPCCMPFRDWPGPGDDGGTTDLHAFALDGRAATYAGSGEVAGRLRDRWSMDAVDGVLRVAVGPTSETGDFSSVVTFEERDGELVELGRVDRLGVGEEIQSVRWFDDLAIVVTFRQIDPLYSIDLADPAKPRQLGELKIPGFSSYLHPIGGDLMIGIGTDADRRGRTRGGQAATFDLGDLRAPERVDVVGYGKRRETRAGQDPRQFTWLPDRRTALTVVAQWGRSGGATAYVSILEVAEDGALDNRMVVGGYGHRAVEGLRTVPLADGRVVLVTQNTARFLHW